MINPTTNPNSSPINDQAEVKLSSCKNVDRLGNPDKPQPNGAIINVNKPNNKNLLFFKFMSFLG